MCMCVFFVPELEFVCVERERFLGAIRTKVKLPGFKPAAAGPPATCPLPLPLYRPASRFPLFYFPSLLLHSHLPSLSFSLVPSSILPSLSLLPPFSFHLPFLLHLPPTPSYSFLSFPFQPLPPIFTLFSFLPRSLYLTSSFLKHEMTSTLLYKLHSPCPWVFQCFLYLFGLL